MEKIKKLNPEKISVLGHKVVVSEEVFSQMVTVINLQSDVINEIITTVNGLIDNNTQEQKDLAKVNKSIKDLAQALKIVLED